MPRIAVCPNCGHKLAESNNTENATGPAKKVKALKRRARIFQFSPASCAGR